MAIDNSSPKALARSLRDLCDAILTTIEGAEKAEKALTSLDRDVADRTTRLAALDGDIAHRRGVIDSLKDETAGLQATHDAKVAELEHAYGERNRALSREYEDNRVALAHHHEERRAEIVQEADDAVAKARAEERAARESLAATLKGNAVKVDEATQKLEDLEAKIAEARKQLDELGARGRKVAESVQ